jgi:DNA polymerase I-like protein with 3'-5' exonuclease and polymerase domains/uracil-DNA glycosylase
MSKTGAIALGCKCEVCPLAEAEGPVLPEKHPGAEIVLVGDAPGERDVKEGRPFVGPAGNLLMSAVKHAGLRRNDIHWTNVILCRPPEGDLSRTLEITRRRNRQIEKINKERLKDAKAEGIAPENVPQEPLIPTPMQCCAPRLNQEMASFTKVIPSGSFAVKQIVGKGAGIFELRGSPVTVEKNGREVKMLPILSASFVCHTLRWNHVLRNDMQRAVRFFRDQMNWYPPQITFNPTAQELLDFIVRNPVLSCDIETDDIECLIANMRCIALGTDKEVMVIGTRPIGAVPDKYLRPDEAQRRQKFWGFYPESELARVFEVLKWWLTEPNYIKVGHNFGYYDYLCLEQQLGVSPAPVLDTMLIHRLVESELPHSLGFVGSVYTDAPSWKVDREGNKKATQSESDRDLHVYCAYDVSVTHAALSPMLEQIPLRQQDEVMKCDHRLQYLCAGMHRVGMYVDQEVRAQNEKVYVQKREDHLKQIHEIAGRVLNPGSTQQLRKLLFSEWKLEPNLEDKFRFTKSGDPSTSDVVIRACLTIPTLEDHQRKLLEQVRYYRKAQKVLGTYIAKIRPSTELAFGWDDDEEYHEQLYRERTGQQKRGITDPRTGRMHPGYNAHVTTTGRLSSSKPINAQNFPGKLRGMVRAAPGHMLVGADADQLELRIAAARWKSIKYLDAFDRNLDPHSSVTALAVFGDRFVKVAGSPPPWPTGTKFKGNAKKLRGLAKSVQYASQYWATVETVHRVITQTEQVDPDGIISLPYLRISLREVRAMHEKWMVGAKFEWGWAKEMMTYQQQGFLAEPVMGRRRDFLDGENPNEIVNFPIQAAGASLMNISILKVLDAIPFECWGPGTGIINQCHDSIVVECPLDGATLSTDGTWDVPKGSIPWRVKHIIEEAMNQTHPGLPGVEFTATADYGLYWDEV